MASRTLSGSTTTVGVGALVVAAVGLAVGVFGIVSLIELADRVKGPDANTIWRIEFARALLLTLFSVWLMLGGIGMLVRRMWGYWLALLGGGGVAVLYAFYLFTYFTYLKSLVEGMGIGPGAAQKVEASAAETFGVIGFAAVFLVGGGGVALFTLLFVGTEPRGQTKAGAATAAPPVVKPRRRPPGP